MKCLFALVLSLATLMASAATIAIIDTGFDLDHDFLKPKILKQETDEEALVPDLKEFQSWNFHDNSHLKTPVTDDQSSLQEILLYRNLRAKGHGEGLSLPEFEWFKKKSSDRAFMDLVKKFKKHSHGTFVAGIALREGDNINIFPIRGLNLPSPVLAVNDNSPDPSLPAPAKLPAEEKFKREIQNSIDRVSRKFSKICHYLSLKKVEVVNASYGITYKNIMTRFRERYHDITGKGIDEAKLRAHVDAYFAELYRRGERTVKRYPKMLFIFSAGNSGLDNELFHHYPSRIKLPNAISVAAMNGEFLASFSNFGPGQVDIGAPGVAILTLIPKVYSVGGSDVYSPASGTSMAAPYVSNLAAQILNVNPKLSPFGVRSIILKTGDEKDHLKHKLASGSVVNNEKALKAALFSRDMGLEEAVTLAKSGLTPMQDSVSMGKAAMPAAALKEKFRQYLPVPYGLEEVEEEPSGLEGLDLTKERSSSPMDPGTASPDSSSPPPSTAPTPPPRSVDPVPSSQSGEPLPPLSGDSPPSASQSPPPLPAGQSPGTSPSSPQ